MPHPNPPYDSASRRVLLGNERKDTILSSDRVDEIATAVSLSDIARANLHHINRTQPVRPVGGGCNVIGKFQSTLMRCSLQYESHKGELAFLYLAHYNENTKYIVDQPCTLELEFTLRDGRRGGCKYTPDFLWIYEVADFVEFKTEEELLKLSSDPARIGTDNCYLRDESGKWTRPAAAKAAAKMGFGFRIVSNAEFSPQLLNNLQFLEDYFSPNANRDPLGAEDRIIDAVAKNPGIQIRELTSILNLSSHQLDTLYFLIAHKVLWVDLAGEPIAPNYTAHVFPTAAHLAIHKEKAKLRPPKIHANIATEINVASGARLVMNGLPSVVERSDGRVVSILNEGGRHELLLAQCEAMVASGEICAQTSANPQEPEADDAWNKLLNLDEEALSVIMRKFRQIEPYLGTHTPNSLAPKTRSQRRYIAQYRKGELENGCGLLGLKDRITKGNTKTIRLDSRVETIIARVIKEEYLSKTAPSIEAIWGMARIECLEHMPPLPPPARNTVRIRVRALNEVDTAKAREGPKIAYSISAPEWLDEWDHISIDGEHAWASAHIDHTPVDLETPPTPDGLFLGRPWLTLMVSPRHKRPLAMALSFEEPSYRSCMAVVRNCVRRHKRLPGVVVVDRGPEFLSHYFDQLLARFAIHKKVRPPSKPRFGAVLERMNCTISTQLFHNLPGNTKLSKNVRALTPSHSPVNLAQLELSEMRSVLAEYLFEILDARPNPVTGISPRALFEKDLRMGGARNHKIITPNRSFRILTMPTTKTGTATVNRRSGIKVNNIYYWGEILNIETGCESVPVRYDPDDISTVFVYMRGEWHECRCRQFQAAFEGLSEREIQNATAEMLCAAHSLHEKRRAISAETLASFLLRDRSSAAAERLRARRIENQKTDNSHSGAPEDVEVGDYLSPPSVDADTQQPNAPASSTDPRPAKAKSPPRTPQASTIINFPSISRAPKEYKIGFTMRRRSGP